MFYEIRTYRLKNGTIPQYLKVVEDEGIEIQKSHLGTLVGYFFSEIGTINEIVHIWAFASLDDREARRERLWPIPGGRPSCPRSAISSRWRKTRL